MSFLLTAGIMILGFLCTDMKPVIYLHIHSIVYFASVMFILQFLKI